MEVTITNAGTVSPNDDVFLSGPKISLPAGESMTWSGISLGDLDNDLQLKGLLQAGKITMVVLRGVTDRAVPTRGSISPHMLPRSTVAQLPTGADAVEGMVAYATNGRKVGEGGGAGTGVPVYYADSAWRSFVTDAAVTV